MSPARKPNAQGGGGGEAADAVLRPRRRALPSILAIAVVAAACGAIASRRLTDRAPQYAQVIAVTPLNRQVRTPHEVCKSEEVRHVRPDLDTPERSAKRERPGARVDDTYTTTEEHCATVFETATQPLGYEVRYRLNGVEGRVHTDHAPGARIRIRDGQLVPPKRAARPQSAGAT